MKIHTFLIDIENQSLNFDTSDLAELDRALTSCSRLPQCEIRHHFDNTTFPDEATDADFVLTWKFESQWYKRFSHLKGVFTPAAGDDWVAADPSGKVSVTNGTFHGPVLAESLLSAILFMNHRMPSMIRNFQARQWNRNLQTGSRLLSNQTILIIGMGHIGMHCAQLMKPLVKQVLGVRRSAVATEQFEIYSIARLPMLLPMADHVVLLLPGGPETNRFMNRDRLDLMQPGAYIYNFGRGNALVAADLIPCLNRLGGAFLDVTENEPLPATSPLWQQKNVFITPHSSCMYKDYTGLYIEEIVQHLSSETFNKAH